MTIPVVSIIIPLFNRIAFIQATLSSITAQSYLDWEAVVVDDGSTDGSYDFVQKLARQDDRIKVYQRERPPKGASTCRNVGLSHASGSYVIFLDSDDLLASYCLEQRVKTIQEMPQIDFVVFNMLLFKQVLTDTNLLWNRDSNESDLARFLRTDGVWSITGPIYRRTALKKLDGFDETLPFWQDLELHVRAICRGFNYVKQLTIRPDCYNRRHQAESISQQGFNTLEKQQKRIEIYQKLVAHAEEYQQLDKKVRISIVSFLFNSARQLVNDYQNLSKAIEVWEYASQKGKIANLFFVLGRLHLRFLHDYRSQNTKVSLYLIFAKLTSFFLPRKYKYVQLTIGQVKNPHELS